MDTNIKILIGIFIAVAIIGIIVFIIKKRENYDLPTPTSTPTPNLPGGNLPSGNWQETCSGWMDAEGTLHAVCPCSSIGGSGSCNHTMKNAVKYEPISFAYGMGLFAT